MCLPGPGRIVTTSLAETLNRTQRPKANQLDYRGFGGNTMKRAMLLFFATVLALVSLVGRAGPLLAHDGADY